MNTQIQNINADNQKRAFLLAIADN